MVVTPTTSTDIQKIEDEFLINNECRVKKKSIDQTLEVDVEALDSCAINLASEVGMAPEVGKVTSSPSLYSFSALIPTGEA